MKIVHTSIQLCSKQLPWEDEVFVIRPTTGQVSHKTFFKVGPGAGPLAYMCLAVPKIPQALLAFPKEGRLKQQAINLTPPKRVKAWGDGPLRPEGSPVVRHTQPEPCHSQTWSAEVQPNKWRGVHLCDTTGAQRRLLPLEEEEDYLMSIWLSTYRHVIACAVTSNCPHTDTSLHGLWRRTVYIQARHCMGNAEYPFIAIAPWSTLARRGSTW